MTASSINTATSRPSWKNLKRRLQGKSEADAEFQDGEYDEPEEFEIYEDED